MSMSAAPSPEARFDGSAESAAHAALMDRVYRRQRFVYDLTRKYYLFGRDRAIRELKLPARAKIVEVGCGTARNLVRIARLYPDAALFGLDASAEMLRSAERAIARANLGGRTGLAQGLAEQLAPGLFGQTERFDAILFSYSLSMIADWRGALRAADNALAPGGRIHIVDFGDLTGLGPVGERGLRLWLSLFHVTPRDGLIGALERMAGRDAHLALLPGRYAFIANLGKGSFAGGE